MGWSTLTVAILPALFGAAGCFGVHQVDHGPWVIDDFEDGNFQPADPRFGSWFCSTFNPANQSCSFGLDPGDQSTNSLFLETTIVDPPDGTGQNGGALLTTEADTPADFSSFAEMVFSLKVTSEDPPLPSTAVVYGQLFCNGAQAEGGTMPTYIYLQQNIPFDSDWRSVSLAMSNFGFPDYEGVKVVGGATACLQQVNSITFTLVPVLPDGQSATGRLNIDDIYFQ
jgi:hypothetical protein